MIRQLVLFILVGFFNYSNCYSQKVSDFTLIQSKGKIPEDFLVKSSETYLKHSKESVSSSGDRKFEKKAKDHFLLKSSFDIRELLYSGRIVFNDTLSSYINKVADVLLESDPVLRSKVRFYIVQSPVVNAFTTNSGQIFINMGLLAYVRSEAQLAFVLAHEITHFKKQHVLKSYVEAQKILYRKGEYRWNTREDDQVTRNQYSRELESEADMVGYDELFKNTPYTPNDIPYLFESLKYADLPYKHEPLDLSLFKITNLPDGIKMNTDISIRERTDNDSTSTHPAPDKRSKDLKQRYVQDTSSTKKYYIVGKEGFEYCRNTARMHLPHMYLSRNNFEKTVYYSTLINQDYPDSKYLKDLIGKGLYGYTLNRARTGNNNNLDYDGGIKRFSEWLNSLNEIELHLLSLNYFNELKANYPEDTSYSFYMNNLAHDLVKNKEYTYSAMYKDYLQSLTLKPNERVKSEDSYYENDMPRVYFIKLIDSMLVKGTIKTLLENASSNIAKEEKDKKGKKRIKGQRRMLSVHGECLGIDSIVLVNPDYEKIDQRKKKSLKYVASEEAQLELNKIITDNASLNTISVKIIDDHTLKVTDVDSYNDLASLTNWFNERLFQLGNDVELGNLNPEIVSQLRNKYGTRYFAWTGYRSMREKKGNVVPMLILSTVYFPLLPFTTYYAIKPKYSTYHYFVLFDIETGKPVFVKSEYIKRKDRNDLLNSTTYDTFYQIKKKKK